MSESPFKTPAPFRFVGGVFGLIFAGIGVTVIANLWFGEMGENAPTFFKIFSSFISLAFIAMGGTLAFTSFFGGGMMGADQMVEKLQRLQASQSPPTSTPSAGPGSYVCPHCGGRMTRADVSPLGDVKCEFCGAWFNIHGKS
jgi:hypothetical protein